MKQGGPDVNNFLNKLGIDNIKPETATVAANLGIAYVFYKVRISCKIIFQGTRQQSPCSQGCV